MLAFAAYALVLICAGVVGLWLLAFGRRRWLGAAILVALGAYGFGPTWQAARSSAALEAEMVGLSYWPDQLELRGKDVRIIDARPYGPCEALCDAVIDHVGAQRVQVVTRGHRDSVAQTGIVDYGAGTVRARQMVEVAGQQPRASLELVGELRAADVYIIVGAQAGLIPELVKWAPAHFGLTPAQAAKVIRAVFVFEGTPAPDNPPVVRMLTGQGFERPPFLPMITNPRYAPNTSAYSAAWQGWLCDGAGDDCRYLY